MSAQITIQVSEQVTRHAAHVAAQTQRRRHLADKILAMCSALEGERKQVTVLFADVVGFSTLAERLDPEDIHTILLLAQERY